METFGLRRTQSLKSLSSEGQERSWVMAASSRWDRKSVSQLVKHYQSCADFTTVEQEEHRFQDSETSVDDGWRRSESRDSVSLRAPGRSSNLMRSRSMDFLPQRETLGTKALCALFESKASVQQSFSNQQLNSTPVHSSKMGREGPLQDWRGHNSLLKDSAIQRNSQEDKVKVVNGLSESYVVSSRSSYEDKHSSSLTKGGSPSRQSRDRISPSSSVRDRSALYLSRAAATDSTGGSTQPEIISTPVTKTKAPKFLLPVKEMCSACLTPVYPMEKMVANTLILHKSCFCCKHCKKKLSIHNYSSLYGEFYCISHYRQLFKRKGNYDEGFGHKQHKDHWLQKNKAKDEPDAVSIPKVTKSTKSNINTHDTIKDTSAAVFVTKSSVREQGPNSGTGVRGKLKMSWPPEKKTGAVNLATQKYEKNNIPDICKTSSYSRSVFEHQKSETKQVKINHGEEVKDRVKTLSSCFSSSMKEETKKTVCNISDKFSLKETKVRNDPIKAGRYEDSVDSTPPRKLHFSVPPREKNITATNQTPEKRSMTKTSKTTFSPTLKRHDNNSNKAKKAVRFSPSIDVAQYEPSSQMSTEDKQDVTQPLDLTEESMGNKSKGFNDEREKNDMDYQSFEGENEVYLEIPEYKCHSEISNTLNQDPAVQVESSEEIPQTDESFSHRASDKVEESVNTFVETVKSTPEIVKHQEPSEMSDITPTDSVDQIKSNNPGAPAEQSIKEEASLQRDKKQTDQANDEESQRKPAARTNSLKASAKPAEKPKAKLGSWSQRKSPLSKLFTSGGSDKTTKADQKDAKKTDGKPGGGLLGRLFQSSSDKAEDNSKSAAQDERNDKTDADGKTTVKTKEAATDEVLQKSAVVQEQELGSHEKKESQSKESQSKESQSKESQSEESQSEESQSEESQSQKSQSKESQSKELSSLDQSHAEIEYLADLLKTPTSGGLDDQTAAEQKDTNQTDDQDSDSQSSHSSHQSVTDHDPGEAESRGLPIAVETESQAMQEPNSHVPTEKSVSEEFKDPINDDIFGGSFSSANVESNTELKTEKSVSEDFKDPFNDDIFGASLSSVKDDPFSEQMNPPDSVPTPKEVLGAPDVVGQDLFGGALLDTNSGLPPASTDLFASDSQELLVNSSGDPFSSPLSDTATSEAAPGDTFSLLDSQSHATSAETQVIFDLSDPLILSDSAPLNQANEQTFSPSSTSSQTREQETNFDIFSSNDFLFTQSPADNVPHKEGADPSTNQQSAFTDDIFGISDISSSVDAFAALPPTVGTSDSLNDFFGADAFSTSAPSAQTDLFGSDIFAAEPQLLPVSQPSDVGLFGDGLLVSDNNNNNNSGEQTAQNTVTGSDWMDDLLG